MNLLLLRLLFDFGLVVLIWIIQLVVYPSFKFYDRAQLLEWHNTYTRRITYVVMPLMLGQLITAAIYLWWNPCFYTIGSMLIIIALWSSTFLQFIPLHNKIAKADFTNETLDLLVQKNWLRTVLWTGVFLMGLVFSS